MNAHNVLAGLVLFFNQLAPFFSWVVLLLATLGAKELMITKRQDRLIAIWTIMGVASMLLLSGIGHSMPDPSVREPQVWRGFFLLPLAFLATLGLCRVSTIKSGGIAGNRLTSELLTLAIVFGIAAAAIPPSSILFLLLVFSATSWSLVALRKDSTILLGQVITALLFALMLSQSLIALSQLLLAPHAYRP